MGAVPFAGGVAFRVWAPHARAVHVVGDFNGWADDADPMAAENDGYWSVDVAAAAVGQEYRFAIDGPNGRRLRKDPYGRDVDHSNGNSIVTDGAFDWGDDAFAMPPWHDLVVYEMHIGTFNDTRDGAPGDLRTAIRRLDHLVELGANAVQIMPAAEFPGSYSWGYNPSDIFAVETDYGGARGLKAFVQAAHAKGIAVIVDVVFNHLGPSDLDLWQFDGWHENDQGGIYFYNDWRAVTPWGHTRPDYGRGEVRRFLRDNALYWLDEFRADGLRWDMTLYIRTVHGNPHDPGQAIAEGWTLMRWINDEIDRLAPWKISIAEDLQDDAAITARTSTGGAGFDAQWAANFVHPVRAALTAPDDAQRDMAAVAAAIAGRYGAKALARVVYTESHDEVANGRARLPHDIAPDDPGGWFARKRSTLGAALVMTAPGIPMLFQGQEFLEDEWFRDTDPLDWTKKERFAGIFAMYRDLIRLRRNWWDDSRGLRGDGVNVFHVDPAAKVVAFHRWDKGGPGDDVVVVANLANLAHDRYRLGLPHAGPWRVRFNGDWQGYGTDFAGQPSFDTWAHDTPLDGLAASGDIGLGAYTAVILTQP